MLIRELRGFVGLVGLGRGAVVRGVRAAERFVQATGLRISRKASAWRAAHADDLTPGAVRGGLAAHHAAAMLNSGHHQAFGVAVAGPVEGSGLAVQSERAARFAASEVVEQA